MPTKIPTAVACWTKPREKPPPGCPAPKPMLRNQPGFRQGSCVGLNIPHTQIDPGEQLCLREAHSLLANHEAKSELQQLMMVLINPQNFMHGQYSTNLLILDRNLLRPVERMKRQNLMNIFYLGGYKSWQFDDSKSDLFANSNITLSWGNIIPLNASWMSALNNCLKSHMSRACWGWKGLNEHFCLRSKPFSPKECFISFFESGTNLRIW